MGLDEDRVRRYIREQEKKDNGQNELFNEHEEPQRPQRGLPHVAGPFGRAFLIPRPRAVVDYLSSISSCFVKNDAGFIVALSTVFICIRA